MNDEDVKGLSLLKEASQLCEDFLETDFIELVKSPEGDDD